MNMWNSWYFNECSCKITRISTNSKEFEIISCGDENIEDGYANIVIVEDQSNLKQPTIHFSLSSDHLEPCLNMKFDELEDSRTCYNVYASRIGFSIHKSHNRLSKDKSLIMIDYVCSRKGFHDRKYQKKRYTNSEPTKTMIWCKTLMGSKKVELRWIVRRLVIKHNYDLVSPRSTSLLRGAQLVQIHDIMITFFIS